MIAANPALPRFRGRKPNRELPLLQIAASPAQSQQSNQNYCAVDPYISGHARVLVNAGPSADDVSKTVTSPQAAELTESRSLAHRNDFMAKRPTLTIDFKPQTIAAE
jgi:hypothetical protein